jgi:UDP-N-acetylglucosamine acyltransferase
MPSIHPSAIVDKKAELGDVSIGPFTVIEAGAVIGDGTAIGPHCHILGRTRIGRNNRIHSGAVIGDLPQDLHYKDEPSTVEIGDGCVIREHVTIHRGTGAGTKTVLGDGVFLMVNSHVAHNCVVDSGAILANGALLAGHVRVCANAFVSGNVVVHQFCRIGRLAMVSGGSRVTMDVPPFMTASGDSAIIGVNAVGIQRNPDMTREDARAIKEAYRALYRGRGTITEAAEALAAGDPPAVVREIIQFIKESSRGVCAGARRGKGKAHEGE